MHVLKISNSLGYKMDSYKHFVLSIAKRCYRIKITFIQQEHGKYSANVILTY